MDTPQPYITHYFALLSVYLLKGRMSQRNRHHAVTDRPRRQANHHSLCVAVSPLSLLNHITGTPYPPVHIHMGRVREVLCAERLLHTRMQRPRPISRVAGGPSQVLFTQSAPKCRHCREVQPCSDGGPSQE